MGPHGNLHFRQHIQLVWDLAAPSSRQSQAPVAPHIALGGLEPCCHSILGLAFPLALHQMCVMASPDLVADGIVHPASIPGLGVLGQGFPHAAQSSALLVDTDKALYHK